MFNDGSTSEVPAPCGHRLLIVDDEPEVRKILARLLQRQGNEYAEAASAQEALALLRSASFDAVLSDIRMPSMDGIELLSKIKEIDDSIAVVMISASQETSNVISAIKFGADDYILKPFDFKNVFLSINRALEKRDLKLKIREYQRNLELMVAKRTTQVRGLFLNVIQSLVHTLEAKDHYTEGHSQRVTWMAAQLAKAADLTNHDIQVIQLGGIFHDIGKIGIRGNILQKVGPLTEEEYSQIKEHPDIGVRILSPLQELQEILPIVRHHHEFYNGRGYPLGLRGEEIPMAARIVSVADTYDAMMSSRPYRDPLPFNEAVSRIESAAGTQLDPRLVGFFLTLVEGNEFRTTLLSSQWKQREHIADDIIADQFVAENSF